MFRIHPHLARIRPGGRGLCATLVAMSTIVRVGSPADFLAHVPHLLGCTPRRSLVLITFAGTRSLGALRVDLPEPDTVAEVASIASTVIGMACKVPQTDAVAVVVYTDLSVADAAGAPHGALVDALRARADICGLGVVDALAVGRDGWNSYLSPLPDGTQPLAEVAARDMADSEPGVHDDQFAAAELPAVEPQEAAAVYRLLGDLERVMDQRGGARLSMRRRAAATEVADDLADPPTVFEAAVTPGGDLGVRDTVALAFCLQRPGLRDVALMQWVGDITTGDATYRAQWAYADGAPFPEDLARPLWGQGARPDPDRLRRALDRCRRVAAATPRDRRAGPLAACAWLAWATGRSTHAATYAAWALDIDSGHVLADIVRAMTDHAHLPEWTFERPARAGSTSPGGRGSSRGSRDR